MTDRYATADHEFRDADSYAQAKYRITLRWLGPSAGRRLYNIGCGGGLFNRLAAESGFTVEAFEPEPAAFALALGNAVAGASISQIGLFDVPGKDVADVIVMHDVLEHLEDDRAALRHVRELLRAEGRLVLSVPAMPRLFGLHDELLGHFRRYTRATLTTALETHFRIVRLRSLGFMLIPVTAYYSRWRRKPYPTASVEGGGAAARVLDGVCALEARVATPVGTSLVCEARPR